MIKFIKQSTILSVSQWDMGPWIRTHVHEDLSACAPGWMQGGAPKLGSGWNEMGCVSQAGEMPTGPSSIWGLCFSSGPCPCICPWPSFSHDYNLIKTPVLGLSFSSGFKTVAEGLQIGSEMLGKEAQEDKCEDQGRVSSAGVRSLG